ncbi:hypothetical protein BTHE_1925 [Bifidobacterium thermophilum]|nr:hypothetical protein BTHE_1925 [Bifidobacterium thermophilum]
MEIREVWLSPHDAICMMCDCPIACRTDTRGLDSPSHRHPAAVRLTNHTTARYRRLPRNRHGYPVGMRQPNRTHSKMDNIDLASHDTSVDASDLQRASTTSVESITDLNRFRFRIP